VRGFGVDVIIIEPGLIRTGFSGTVANAIAENTEADGVRVMMAPHKLLPDRARDAFLRTQFSQPGKE
jgi:short-subunit dehydrogenase